MPIRHIAVLSPNTARRWGRCPWPPLVLALGELFGVIARATGGSKTADNGD